MVGKIHYVLFVPYWCLMFLFCISGKIGWPLGLVNLFILYFFMFILLIMFEIPYDMDTNKKNTNVYEVYSKPVVHKQP